MSDIITTCKQDLLEIKESLINYDGNKERFFDTIKATVTTDLKSFFDAGNNKLLRLNNNLFEDHK